MSHFNHPLNPNVVFKHLSVNLHGKVIDEGAFIFGGSSAFNKKENNGPTICRIHKQRPQSVGLFFFC